jgi:hypothetical protein
MKKDVKRREGEAQLKLVFNETSPRGDAVVQDKIADVEDINRAKLRRARAFLIRMIDRSGVFG